MCSFCKALQFGCEFPSVWIKATWLVTRPFSKRSRVPDALYFVHGQPNFTDRERSLLSQFWLVIFYTSPFANSGSPRHLCHFNLLFFFFFESQSTKQTPDYCRLGNSQSENLYQRLLFVPWKNDYHVERSQAPSQYWLVNLMLVTLQVSIWWA